MVKISLKTTNKIKIILDVITGISTLVLLSPPLTGIAVHEWLGLALIIPLLLHLLINWGCISITTRRFFGKLPGQARINYILYWVLFILMTAEGFTGIMISRTVLPTFGLSESHIYIYKYLHILLADSLLVVFGLHLAMNWRRAITMIKNFFTAPIRNNPNSINSCSLQTSSGVKAE